MKKIVDIKIFDTKKKLEEYTLEELAKKLFADTFRVNELPEWMYLIDIPEDTKLIELSADKCFMRLNMMAQTQTLSLHTSYAMSKLNAKKTLDVTPDGVIADGKEMGVTLGVLSKDPDVVVATVNATLLSFTTRAVDETTIDDVVFSDLLGVPVVSNYETRKKLQNYTNSAIVARDELYQQFILQSDLNYKLQTVLGDTLDNFKYSEPLSQRYGFDVKLATTNAQLTIKKVTSVAGLYRMKFASSTARGEEKRRGSITAGYAMFEMTANDAKILNLIRDFTNMLEVTKSKIIVLNSATVPVEVVKSIGLKYLVHYEGAAGYPLHKEEENGVFSLIRSKLPRIKYRHFSSEETKPIAKKDKILFKTSSEQVIVETLKYDVDSFTYMYITGELDPGLMYYPVSDADSCKVMVMANREGAPLLTLSQLVYRACAGLSARNNFPFLRIPFSKVDPLDDLVHWRTPIRLPKLTSRGLDIEIPTEDTLQVQGYNDIQAKDIEVVMKRPISNVPVLPVKGKEKKIRITLDQRVKKMVDKIPPDPQDFLSILTEPEEYLNASERKTLEEVTPEKFLYITCKRYGFNIQQVKSDYNEIMDLKNIKEVKKFVPKVEKIQVKKKGTNVTPLTVSSSASLHESENIKLEKKVETPDSSDSDSDAQANDIDLSEKDVQLDMDAQPVKLKYPKLTTNVFDI